MRKKRIFKYLLITALVCFAFLFYWQITDFSFPSCSHRDSTTSINEVPKKQESINKDSSTVISGQILNQKITLKIDDSTDANDEIEEYLRNIYPIISEKVIEQVQSTKTLNYIGDSANSITGYNLSFEVPKNFLEDKINLLWELNIAAFHSRLYQIFNNDTLLIDTWPNVVGKPSTKTFTGNYEAFMLRNWPFWKDPDDPDSVKPTPPGPKNPLGLFVVHYDKNSLRYFHGTNKNYLLKNVSRALSHGCVRNLNENIAKMKEFIIKRVIKSDDLSSWLKSKRTMTYEIKDADKFPVRIIYKTYDIDLDNNGYYVIFYKDVYNYEKNMKLSEYDDPKLIKFASEENVISEFNNKKLSSKYSSEKIIPILKNLAANHEYYKKYYFDDLMTAEQQKN